MEKTKSVRKLAPEHLECREFHLWDELDADTVRETYPRPSFGWLRIYICMRCKTEKREIINTYGYVESRQYTYPDGYLMEDPVKGKYLYRKEIARRRGVRIRKQRNN